MENIICVSKIILLAELKRGLYLGAGLHWFKCEQSKADENFTELKLNTRQQSRYKNNVNVLCIVNTFKIGFIMGTLKCNKELDRIFLLVLIDPIC